MYFAYGMKYIIMVNFTHFILLFQCDYLKATSMVCIVFQLCSFSPVDAGHCSILDWES